MWKQSPADLRSQSHCSLDKLENWLLLDNNTDSTEFEHFVVMYLFYERGKCDYPARRFVVMVITDEIEGWNFLVMHVLVL